MGKDTPAALAGQDASGRGTAPHRERLENVVHWIRQTLNIPEGAADITELPVFSNYVDHQSLFTEPTIRRAASPARLWRISPYIFRHAVNSVSGKPLSCREEESGRRRASPCAPFYDAAALVPGSALPHGFEEATTELLVDMAWLVAGYQAGGPPPPGGLARTTGKRKFCKSLRKGHSLSVWPSAACPMSSPRKSRRLVELAERTEPNAGRREAMQTILAAVLVMPEAVFRVETGQERQTNMAAHACPCEMAFAISYALTDSPPDPALRAMADEGRLASREDVKHEVERLLADRGIEKPRILRFFWEYFEYTRVTEIFKDGRIRKHYMPGAARRRRRRAGACRPGRRPASAAPAG